MGAMGVPLTNALDHQASNMGNNRSRDMGVYTFVNVKGSEVTPEQLKQCRDLYSTSYGVWSSQGPRPHRAVAASVHMLRQQFLFDSTSCGIVTAKDIEGCLVGQALYAKYPYLLLGKEVLWITQLVVREDHRHRGVATSMIRKCWMDSHVWACGLVSCHPYAVKALEEATKTRCNKSLSAQHANGLIQQSCVPYVQDCDVLISMIKCAIQTNFHVDHTLVDGIRASLPDWQLGSLDQGEEYFAFTFKDCDSTFDGLEYRRNE